MYTALLGRSVSGRSLSTRHLSSATALRGSLAIALFAFSGAAFAQDECGMAPIEGGTVICETSGNPYADGITYIAPLGDLTIALEDGVVVDTTGGLNVGILGLTIGDTALAVEGGTNTSIITDAQGAFGVLGATDLGALSLTLDEISTTGDNATAIIASSAGGLTNVTVNSITTTGAGADGINANTNFGAIVIEAGTITTSGAGSNGIVASSDGSDITISADTVSTTGGSVGFFNPGASGIVATTGFTGDITIDAGEVSTTGDAAIGVRAQTFDGLASVTVGEVSTTGVAADGVNVLSTSGLATVDAGTVSTTGLNARGIVATGLDGVNVAFDTVTTSGDGATGVSVPAGVLFFGPPSTATAIISGGSVSTSGDNATGINVVTTTGPITVNFASVDTAGTTSNGVSALSVGGDVNITGEDVSTTGDNSVAINAVSTAGDVRVTTTGAVASTGLGGTGIFASSLTGNTVVRANSVSTVAADPANLASGNGAITAIGTNATVVTTGSVTTAGLADAISVTATDGDARAIVNDVAVTGAGSRAVVVTSTGISNVTVNGTVRASGAGSDTLVVTGDVANVTVNGNGSVLSTSGNSITLNSVTSSTLTNTGTIANAPGGLAVLALGGPITINNAGNLTSDIQLTAGDDRINNTGTFIVGANPNFGAGADVFANSGTVVVGSGAPGLVNPVFTGLETFTNTGLVDLRNNRAGDTLTLPGTFTGSGDSRLGLDIAFGASPVADRLTIGGSASGQTAVVLNRIGNAPAQLNSGIILVQAGAASGGNAFGLAGGAIEEGLVRTDIVYNPTDFTFRLSSAPSDAAFRTLNYADGARNLWLKSADVVNGQLRSQRDTLWAYGGGETSPRLWMQMHGSVETRESGQNFNVFGQSRFSNTGYEQDYFGGQLGFDIGGGIDEKGGFAFGVTGGYINSSLNFAGSSDKVRFDAVNAGVYASMTTGNFFVNALAKYDYYWADASSFGAAFDESLKGNSYGARGEVGFRFGSDSFFIEPAASVSYVKTDFDNFNVLGTDVRFDEEDSIRGRAGARVGGQVDLFGSKAAFYLGGNYVHEFRGADRVVFTGGGQSLTFQNQELEDYGEGVLGLSVGQANGVSGFIEGSYIRSFSDNNAGNLPIEGAGGRAGLRIRF